MDQSDIIKRLEELELRISKLEDLKKNDSKGPDDIKKEDNLDTKTANELLLEDKYICMHYFNKGENKGKICGKKDNLYISEKPITEKEKIEDKDHHLITCSKHNKSKRLTTKKILNELRGIENLIKKKDDNDESVKDTSHVFSPATSAAKYIDKFKNNNDLFYLNSKNDGKIYCYNKIKCENEWAIVRYGAKKDGSFATRPSPKLLGSCIEEPNENNYIENLDMYTQETLNELKLKINNLKEIGSLNFENLKSQLLEDKKESLNDKKELENEENDKKQLIQPKIELSSREKNTKDQFDIDCEKLLDMDDED